MSEVLHLSPSIAATVIARSPLRAWQQHSKGGNKGQEVTDEMRRGKLIDRLLFQTGAEIVIVDADSWRTNAAKQAREEAENKGAIAVLREKYEDAERIANDLRGTLYDRGINLAEAKAQHRVVWVSDGVACKGFLDALFLGEDSATIYDLKTTDNAAPENLRLDVRASIQHAAYIEAIESLHPELMGRVTMKFIYAEPDGLDLTIAEPDGMLRSLGASRWKRAVRIWGECVRTSIFPGYPKTVATVGAKPWDMDTEMAANVAAAGTEPF